MFKIKFLAIIFAIAATATSCLQQKIENANRSTSPDVPAICRQYKGTSDYATCQFDPGPYLLHHNQLVEQEKARIQAEEKAAQQNADSSIDMTPLMPTPTPPLCSLVGTDLGVTVVVERLLDYWPWGGTESSSIQIAVSRDIDGDGAKEFTVYSESEVDLLPWLVQPDDEVCVIFR